MPYGSHSFLRHALVRIGLSIAAGIAAYFAVRLEMPSAAAALVAVDAGSAVLLAISWTAIASSDAQVTRARAGAEDPGRTLVSVIVVLARCV